VGCYRRQIYQNVIQILQLIYFIIVSAFVEVQVSMTFGNLVQ
jgi:hypothetical protein